jgi:hypothetical protein
MLNQTVSSFEEFIQKHPQLYRKLCYWASWRDLDDPAAQVQEYITELVLEAKNDRDNGALVKKWAQVLSLQERNGLAQLSPIKIKDYPNSSQWYKLQQGEYSVIDEPELGEICYSGKQMAVLTRNRYDCLILNTDRLLIVDVDIGVPKGTDLSDCPASCQMAISQQQAIAALEALVEQFPQLGFRVYRTRNGLRYLCTTHEFHPLEPKSQRLMKSLYADPLYARLCKFQATFRARLTPKPWRVEPNESIEQLIYDRSTGMVLPSSSSPYAVCHLIEIVGEQSILPEFAPTVEAHDAYCRVSRLGLQLA